MAKCEIKTGLFVLQQCGQPGVVSCSQCGRQACRKHTHKTEKLVLCSECYAQQIRSLPNKQAAQLKKQELQIGNKKHYGEWFFRQREILFYELYIEPFDESDFAAFNAEVADDYFDETDAGGLFDS